MSALVQPSRLAQVLRLLPGPVLRALDTWSRGVATRRRDQRQQRWAERKAAQLAQANASLKVFGD